MSSCCVVQVTESADPPPPPTPEGEEGIVGALMMVMQKRSKVIHSSGKHKKWSHNKLFTRQSHKIPYVCLCAPLQVKVRMMVGMKMTTTMNGMTDEAVVVILKF